MNQRRKRQFISILILILLVGPVITLGSQETERPKYLIKNDGSGCEIFANYVLELKDQITKQNDRLFVIAQLGDGETTEQINWTRLDQIKSWFDSLGLKTEKLILASGQRVPGQGQVKIYVGNQYYLQGLAARNARLCLGELCETGCNKPIKHKPRK